MKIELAKELCGSSDLTKEEEEAMDAMYLQYSNLRRAYEYLIGNEYDPCRIKIIEDLLEDLNEENK